MSEAVESAWDRIEFQLDTQEGFWLGVLIRRDAESAQRLRARAARWCREHDRRLEIVHLDVRDPSAFLESLTQEEQTTLRWVIGDPYSLMEPVIVALNERRDAMQRSLQDGLILESGPALMRGLRVLAPDLFTIRAFFLDIVKSEDDLGSGVAHLKEHGDAGAPKPGPWLLSVLLGTVEIALRNQDHELACEYSRTAVSVAERLAEASPEHAGLQATWLVARAFRIRALAPRLGQKQAEQELCALLADASPPPGLHPATWGRALRRARGTAHRPIRGTSIASPTPADFLALPLSLQCEALARLEIPGGPAGFGGSIEQQLQCAVQRHQDDPEAPDPGFVLETLRACLP